jgi:predicted adenine nucleotide alpha hydrolase (AANH) superfamily ATPase
MSGPSLLLHCCCAHCTAYTVDYWRRQGYSVHGYWYNPNIHPYAEHQTRLEAMKSLAGQLELPLVIADSYDIIEYFRRVAGDEAGRCRHCFRLRLLKTAIAAREMGVGAFTTSLLISSHQQHDLLGLVGREVAGETGLDFAYADLRKRYSDSRRITKGRQLYRQQYCGCLYSEGERYKAIKID